MSLICALQLYCQVPAVPLVLCPSDAYCALGFVPILSLVLSVGEVLVLNQRPGVFLKSILCAVVF